MALHGKTPYFHFYPSDWLSSTSVSLMSPAEEGAYIRLLCHAWASADCGLPDDDTALAELSRLRMQWKHSGPRIRRCFEKIGDRLFNPKLVEEHQKLLEWRAKSSEGGRHSAVSKKQAPLTNGCKQTSSNSQAPFSNGCKQNSTSHISYFTVNTNTSASDDARVPDQAEPKAVDPVPAWFAEWWEIYWLKRDKKGAYQSFRKQVKTEERFRLIMDATRSQSAEMAGREPRHRPYGATWLNRERWEDEISLAGLPNAPTRRLIFQ